MNDQEKGWTRIAEHINELPFAGNDIAVIEFEGRKICVARRNGQAFAFSYKCPHACGILAFGHIDSNCHLVCPLHRYRFDMKNGRNVSGEGYYLKHWKVRIDEEGVFIGNQLNG